MIEWGAPWAFWLFVPILLLPLQARLTGRNRLAVPSTASLRRRPTLRLALVWLPPALRIAGLSLLVLALARPQLTHRDVLVEAEGLDILLAVDTSGSMDARDFRVGGRPVSRMEVANGVMANFIEGRPFDRIGIVPFGEEAFTYVPLTLDHAALLDAVEHVQIGLAGRSATAIGAAIAVSARRMTQVDATERVVILLTDGKNNVERPDPIQAAHAAAAVGIRVYTIGIGGRREIDEPLMQRISEVTGGRYFHASDTRTLVDIYATIDELETSKAEVREIVRHEELFRRWLIPGAVLLLLDVLLSATFLRRSP